MIKFLLLLMSTLTLVYSNCNQEWIEDKNQCLVFYHCSNTTTDIEWHGKCKNGKIDGEGILEWDSGMNATSVELNNSVISRRGYFFGTAKEGKFDQGVLMSLKPENDIYIGSFHKNNLYLNGIVLKDSKRVMGIGNFDLNRQMEGEGFLAFFSTNVFEHGTYKSGKREKVLLSYVRETNENGLCDIVSAMYDESSVKYQSYFKGYCRFRTEILDYQVVSENGKVWVSKGGKLYLKIDQDRIYNGTFNRDVLNGEGLLITPNSVLKGVFRENEFIKGWRVNHVSDQEMKIEEVK